MFPRWLIGLLLLLIVWRLIRDLLRGVAQGMNGPGAAGGGSAKPSGPPKTGELMARDPVCGVFVVPTQAVSLAAGGTTHYFCSDKCRQAFSTGAAASQRSAG